MRQLYLQCPGNCGCQLNKNLGLKPWLKLYFFRSELFSNSNLRNNHNENHIWVVGYFQLFAVGYHYQPQNRSMTTITIHNETRTATNLVPRSSLDCDFLSRVLFQLAFLIMCLSSWLDRSWELRWIYPSGKYLAMAIETRFCVRDIVTLPLVPFILLYRDYKIIKACRSYKFTDITACMVANVPSPVVACNIKVKEFKRLRCLLRGRLWQSPYISCLITEHNNGQNLSTFPVWCSLTLFARQSVQPGDLGTRKRPGTSCKIEIHFWF
jgi:hypothetical protein